MLGANVDMDGDSFCSPELRLTTKIKPKHQPPANREISKKDEEEKVEYDELEDFDCIQNDTREINLRITK